MNSGSSDLPRNTKVDGSLPQTGMSTYFSNLGLLLILIASYFILTRRRKERAN
ncbi:hypothetical protein DEX24_04425 [Kurthia sibirica]|uniref:Gram-positive cocci surface proteins LPxTG domain-containing protein n=1 Tax=Kurthia sibirica TaxID=202750 RepID=A0A2U3ANT3_9BACL|nr:hypothetical protein DEX24_04425 [Kurthia sibirica]